MRRAAFLLMAAAAAGSACRREPVVRPGDTALVSYELSVDGTVAETNFGEAPLAVVQGSGALPPGADAALLGLRAGQEVRLELPPEKAFGARDAALVQTLPLKSFGALAAGLKAGQKVSGFRDGRAQTAVVLSVDREKAVLDFNPPLAGRTVIYRLRVVGLPAR